MLQPRFITLALLVACTPDTNDVSVRLAPEVISSIDGTLGVSALVLADRQPSEGETVDVTVAYTDRNGTPHDVAPATGTTDSKGQFDTTLTGLTWDGTGTVTVTVQGGGPTGTATFAVLDRTPPKLTITPPASSSVRAGQDITVDVHITDEIGASQIYFEWSGQFQNQQGGRQRASVVSSGSTDATVKFDFQVPDAIGAMITLYALGADLSGNEAAAQPVTVTVVP